jgi:hypothetical protein
LKKPQCYYKSGDYDVVFHVSLFVLVKSLLMKCF